MNISTSQSLSIEEKIGQLLMVGFHGSTAEDPRVQEIVEQAKNGQISGVGIFKYNIKDKNQLESLLATFTNLEVPLLITLDQEGGKVQRLNSGNGFSDTSSAREVAGTMSPEDAYEHYSSLGSMLSTAAFNFNCAPCVDLDDSPGCKVIGGIDRSYSSSISSVVEYAEKMIDGLADHKVLNCIKHFPGHGRASDDSHERLVDITNTWTEEELEPFRLLIETGKVDAVMSAHLMHQGVDPEFPGTLSSVWLSKLREDLNFEGVIVSDCLHMGGIIKHFSLNEIVVHGLNAGIDLFYFSNNPLSAQDAGVRHSSDSGEDHITFGDWKVPDMKLADKFKNAVLQALEKGEISEEQIDLSYERVKRLKSKI